MTDLRRARERPPASRRAHLVLGAGGVRCTAYIGALEQLEQEGYEFVSVSTCSAGTLVGALYCAGVSPRTLRETILKQGLRDLAGDVRWKWLRRLWTLRSWPYALYRDPGIPRLFRRVLEAEGLDPDPTLNDLRTPMATAALDVAAARLLVYTSETNPTMPVSELLRIATAIPLMYRPHVLHDREILDAAVASYLPVWLATGQREELPIVAVRVSAVRRPASRQTLTGWVGEVLATAVESRDTFDLDRVPGVTTIDVRSPVSAFEFDLSREEIAELIELGRVAVAQHFEIEEESLLASSPPSGPPVGDDSLAERQAERLFQRHLDRLARRAPVVFISYANEDREWVERLRDKLRPLIVDKNVTVWDDAYIPAGRTWDAVIHEAILRARVAVLLISSDFKKSSYAIDTELALLRVQAADGRVRIFWVSLDGSRPDDPEQALQAGHDPDRPLANIDPASADETLRRLAGLIVKEFERIAAEARGGGGRGGGH